MIVNNWNDLSKTPNESPSHILMVDLEMGCAHLYAKNPQPYDGYFHNNGDLFKKYIPFMNHYLSTHSFYGKHRQWTQELLNRCGFDVQIPEENKDD